jgi:hypothetical protein
MSLLKSDVIVCMFLCQNRLHLRGLNMLQFSVASERNFRSYIMS